MATASLAVGLVAPGAVAEAAWENAAERAEHAAGDVSGTVKDPSGGALVGAQVTLLTPQRAVVAATITDQSGKFTVSGLADGQYVVNIKYPGLKEAQAVVTVAAGKAAALNLQLEIVKLGEDVTVTANLGSAGELNKQSQPVNVISNDDVMNRSKTVFAQAFDEEVGLALQRTSPGMSGVFVRGLTGGKVNVFIDGVRFTNGAQRGGVNTFLNLIDPTTVDGVEVLRGPSSAQYGSDALGGSIQVLSNVPLISADKKQTISASFSAGAESAHVGGFGQLGVNYARSNFGMYGSFSGRKTGDYKPGGGEDTHAAVTRFLGVPSSVLYPERMPGTGFTSNALQLRSNWVINPDFLVVGNYIRTRQDGANRWDQTLGGDGNLIAELNDLQFDLAYARIETSKAGWFDHASATYSFNTQREERVNQGGQGNALGAITHQPERTSTNGIQANLVKQLSPRYSLTVGGDNYFEKLTSVAFDVNPVNGVETLSRPRVPDQATFLEGGIFAQTNVNVTDTLGVNASMRFGWTSYKADVADAPIVNGAPLWPNDSHDTQGLTYRVGAAWRMTDTITFVGSVSTGYRAPNMTDLGTLGLTGSGFEVAAPDIAGLGGFVGTTADATAVSSGIATSQVESETSTNFDGGIHFKNKMFRIELNAFSNKIYGNIQKQSLILPQGAVGTVIGGQTITSQNANGAVFVPASTNPVLVRANYDDARIWGIEWLGEVKVTTDITVGSIYTYLRAKDTATGLPPNIEGGTPAPTGSIWARWTMSERGLWIEPYFNFAQEQKNLSTLDQGDRRTGATRTRAQIQNYFRRGATENGWVDFGPDGVRGNADDFLIATGETLTQIQDRVLGVGVNSAPLWTSVPAWQMVGIRLGYTFLKHHTIFVDFENLGNESRRGISWGQDAPARGISVRYILR